MQLNQTRCISLTLLIFFSTLVVSCSTFALTIGVVHDNVTERYNFFDIEQSFHQQFPNIPIKFIGLPSAKYKPQVNEWLATGTGPDVLFWHGGVRLKQFVEQGYVDNLDGLSEQYNWDKKFSAATLQTVSFQRSIFAIPISFYQWGIFYNKHLLKQFNIEPPNNWQNFIAACNVLKSNKIDPIALGSREPWILGAWFDYIDLRLNGLDFHQQLLSGEIPYTDQRVVKVFEYWTELLDKECFLTGHQELNWSDAMPYLFRDLSAFTLIGNFLSVRIPDDLKQKIGFMPFPEIIPANSGFEEAPMDVFFIRASSKNKEDAKKFLTYLSKADVQTNYNKYAGGFPPNKSSTMDDSAYNKAGLKLLQQAEGLSQFFDRDSVDDFSEPALIVLAEFMQNTDIKAAVQKLEHLRQTKLLISVL